MTLSNRLEWETLRTIDSATFTGAYQKIGPPLVHPSYILKVINNSNVIVTFSDDGVTDIDVLPADSFFLYDQDTSDLPTAVAANTQFYVKGAAGVGLVYLVSIYIV
jgi:hypothetical protein